jgi:putative methionine-R-sulfoxide reductase with GAF domain
MYLKVFLIRLLLHPIIMIEVQVKQIKEENDHGSDSGMLYITEAESENKSGILKIKKNHNHEITLAEFSQKLLSFLAAEKEISQGVFFVADTLNGTPVLKFLSAYAHHSPDDNDRIIEFGEGFPGQAAKDGKIIIINDIPEGYMPIESGLGKSSPVSLIIIPVKHEGKVLAVIELASFHKFTENDEQFFGQISQSVAEQILSFDK